MSVQILISICYVIILFFSLSLSILQLFCYESDAV